MTSPTIVKPKQRGLTNTFLALLGRSSAEQQEAATAAQPHVEASSKSRTELSRLKDERARLRGLHNAELEKQAELEAQLQAVEAERIEALAEHRMSGDATLEERAEELLVKATALRQAISDTAAVAARIQARVEALKPEIDNALSAYRTEFGQFLDAQMREAADAYRTQALRLAETITTIAALQQLMIRLGAGNSNGFWSDARLPQIVPGDGRIHSPLLDAATPAFADRVSQRAAELAHELAALGFPAPDR